MHDPSRPCRICCPIFSHAFQALEVKHQSYTYTLRAQPGIHGNRCMTLWGLAEYAFQFSARPSRSLGMSFRAIPILSGPLEPTMCDEPMFCWTILQWRHWNLGSSGVPKTMKNNENNEKQWKETMKNNEKQWKTMKNNENLKNNKRTGAGHKS